MEWVSREMNIGVYFALLPLVERGKERKKNER